MLPEKRIGDGVLDGGGSLFVYFGCHGADWVDTIRDRIWSGVVTIEQKHRVQLA